jgi:hypothetical protein
MNITTARIILCYESPSNIRTARRITVNLAFPEVARLENYCEQTGKTATDVIRELIERLPVV